jgi:hypothetical protein
MPYPFNAKIVNYRQFSCQFATHLTLLNYEDFLNEKETSPRQKAKQRYKPRTVVLKVRP